MRTELFDFDLPESLIALRPASPRDAARLLVVDPHGTEQLADRMMTDLPGLIAPGDALVFNDTRVIPAALKGTRTRGDAMAQVSVNLTERLDDSRWLALARPAKRLEPGDRIQFGDSHNVCALGSLDATVAARGPDGEVTLAFDLSGAALHDAIETMGAMPLPPYIAARRAADDRDRSDYQTTSRARRAPWPRPPRGCHFTASLMQALEGRGVTCHFVTLHVGPGTFLPVRAEDTEAHKMHAEHGVVSTQVALALNAIKARGNRIVAVGTTSLRLLESAADEFGTLKPFSGETDIFITPGYRFRFVDRLLTNFHLPRSTLFMLVAAFSGLDTMKRAYAHAVAERYRFYSYGDACLLDRARHADD
ncbi:S-adenosylmethionine:tRNA ribosyltransferase-isomerase [Methyloceanibacter superfactus]|uniref:S-adenosylmethionine:tRNA ribosyltransferase-isomerase n=1 Tax=Methyloceanibacter superfactus TaxID=1774969 RepID=A0A1E3VIW1_9HYPH|nr:tRNA preQ1(34) S-adenosylmethionine ribosyltransferase-isomerase QueA [Methyloceanibacter superfactus]ODR93459.1 S-adenosylmethionine:tRNA ribosyltransferase-isomerase [Methyloceanibacter superfactus]